VAAKATVEGGRVTGMGWWGGRRDCSHSRRGVQRSSSNVIDRTMTVEAEAAAEVAEAAEAAAEAVAEAAAEAAVVARRIATPPPPTGSRL